MKLIQLTLLGILFSHQAFATDLPATDCQIYVKNIYAVEGFDGSPEIQVVVYAKTLEEKEVIEEVGFDGGKVEPARLSDSQIYLFKFDPTRGAVKTGYFYMRTSFNNRYWLSPGLEASKNFKFNKKEHRRIKRVTSNVGGSTLNDDLRLYNPMQCQ